MNTEFTYELEHWGKLPFLDALFRRTGKNIYTTVYKKATKNNIYILTEVHLHHLAAEEVHLRHL